MDDRRKTAAAITLILIVLALIVFGIIAIAMRKKAVVSPIPEEGAIKIIFVTLTPTPPLSPSFTPTPTVKPKVTATPKSTPTKAASPSATPKP